MRDVLVMTGMVLKSSPVGESDRRLVILTRERGKITAFARAARKPGNQLMAASRPFSFGQFWMFEGRDSYTLQRTEISNYFEELATDMEAACYGSYFLEFADYYSRENLDGSDVLLLLYQSLRALSKPSIPNRLIQCVFELKAMELNGEYTMEPPGKASEFTAYAWNFILVTPIEKLYTFTVQPEVLQEMCRNVDTIRRRYVDREFHSLEILKDMTAIQGSGE